MDSEKKLDALCAELAGWIEADEDLDLERAKKTLAKKHGVRMVQNATVLARLPPGLRTPTVLAKLRSRLTRTGSGVTPIALMPKPFVCPGRCTYCPQGENAPKAYTGFEPATMRAIQNEYDAGRQIRMRLSQYEALGQPNQKCELIVMGGTFLSVPLDYQHRFVKECYEALNGAPAPSLAAAQTANQTAAHRMIGMTIETRPDWCQLPHIDRMLGWGATRVELGVQSLNDAALERVKRGHGQAETVRATRQLKDAAFKVGYHFMPGLYSDATADVAMMRRLFEDPDYCPDMLKIYPCLVMPGTPLYDEWKAGRFEPIDSEEAVRRVVAATPYFPPWVRVMRMQRDIPASKIAAGVKAGNLHQMVVHELERQGKRCRCIRCREVFSSQRYDRKLSRTDYSLVERKYAASGGIEHFLSFEDVEQDLLAGFVRLRLSVHPHRPELTPTTGLVRELHVYGSEVELGSANPPSRAPPASDPSLSVQHTGMGRRLLTRAEQIASDAGMDRMAIISGVGARPYYARAGYALAGPYMVKRL